MNSTNTGGGAEMPALRAMTPNPACEVCEGTGTDPVFHTDCTECWPNEPSTAAQIHCRRTRPAVGSRVTFTTDDGDLIEGVVRMSDEWPGIGDDEVLVWTPALKWAVTPDELTVIEDYAWSHHY